MRLAVQDRSVEVSEAAKLVKDLVLHAISCSTASNEDAEVVREALKDLFGALKSMRNDPTSDLQRELVLKAQLLVARILQLPLCEDDSDMAERLSQESLRLFGLSESWPPPPRASSAPELVIRSSIDKPTSASPVSATTPAVSAEPHLPPPEDAPSAITSDNAMEEADELLREFSMDSLRPTLASRGTPMSAPSAFAAPDRSPFLARDLSVMYDADDLLRDLNRLSDGAMHKVDTEWKELKKAQSAVALTEETQPQSPAKSEVTVPASMSVRMLAL